MAEATKNYGLVVEMHFDSFTDPKAHGCHAMYYVTNSHTKHLAFEFGEANQDVNGIVARASVAVTRPDQRGAGFILNQKTDALLLEFGYGSNLEDSRFMLSTNFNIEKVLDAIHPLTW